MRLVWNRSGTRLEQRKDLLMASAFMGLKQFAEHIGRSPSYVTKLKDDGRLVLAKDGRVRVKASLKRIAETAGGRDDVSERHANERVSRTRLSSVQHNSASGSRAQAQKSLLEYEVKLGQLNLGMQIGHRFYIDAAEREAVELGAMMRGGIERLIDSTSPRITGASNRQDSARIIRAEIVRLRSVFKRELPRALRRLRDNGNGAD